MRLASLRMWLAAVGGCVLTAAIAGFSAGADGPASTEADAATTRQVSRLVRQLNDDAAARREAAEQQLMELAGTNATSVDRLLALLPEESDQMPLAVRDALARVRRQAEDAAAKAAVAATTVTLTADGLPLWDAFKLIEQQTGNRFVDHQRQALDADARGTTVTATFDNVPFWSAVDQLLDQAGLGIYPYAGDDALAVVAREAGDRPRHGPAVYAGPFRLEVLEVQAQRNLREPERTSLRLQVEVAWEPRLRPIAVSQSAAELAAVDEGGGRLAVARSDAVLSAEVATGTQATELVLPLELPPRDVAQVASLRGKLRTLVPGRQVKFRFDELASAAGKSQRRGGVEVAVDAVRKNHEIWEIHMRLRLDEENRALESHRGWAFQNLSYLVDRDGQTIDNAGLETTMQRRNEVGVAYFFDLPAGLDGLEWVYETPAAIVELVIDYELKDIPLP